MTVNEKKSKLIWFVLFVLLICFMANCDDTNKQKQQQNDSDQQNVQKQQIVVPSSSSVNNQNNLQIVYTENITQFKNTKYNQRLQSVVGCWLMVKQYLTQQKSNYLFNHNVQMKNQISLLLVKECMKNINRKDSILKITSLVGKNMSEPKKYDDLVKDKTKIDQIFIQVNKKYISINYNQHQVQSNQIINQQQIQTNVNQQLSQTSQFKYQQLQNSLSEFDQFLLELLKKYENDLKELHSGKDGIKGRVQQELKKRQKYYFGFIPATQFTHSVFLVTISLSMVFFCTCFKYYKMRNKKKKLAMTQQDQQSSSMKKIKKPIRVNQMSRVSMKKKIK